MEKTLLYYDLILDKNRQMKIFGESSLKQELKKFSKNETEENFTYLNRPDGVIIEIVTLNDSYIFGSYGRLSNFDDDQLIRSRNKDDFTYEDIENLIETYTYYLMDLETQQVILLNNHKCRGFVSFFPKFLGERFNLNNYYDNILLVIKKDENIKEKLFQATTLDEIKLVYSSDQLLNNDFISPNELYELEKESVKQASVKLKLEAKINNKKLKENLLAQKELSQHFNKFEISTNEGLVDLIEKKLTKKVQINIKKDEINNLDMIEELLFKNLITVD